MSELCGHDLQKHHHERGDGLVELAIILPVLLLILFAILDLGRAVYAYSVVANCAREAARYGIISPEDDGAIAAVALAAAVGLDPGQMTVTVSHPGGDSVQVQIEYGFTVVTPLLAQVLGGGPLALSSSATMYRGY